MTAVETVEQAQLATRPAIKPGDTVRVSASGSGLDFAHGVKHAAA